MVNTTYLEMEKGFNFNKETFTATTLNNNNFMSILVSTKIIKITIGIDIVCIVLQFILLYTKKVRLKTLNI